MIKVGITGQSGFIGGHLYNFLGLKAEIERIPFQDDFFNDQALLENFVMECNVIVHLAALNRHNDPQEIYNTNIKLVKQLINACINTNSKPHIIFSSSIQEQNDNIYGKSKLDGRNLFEEWSRNYNSKFTGLLIPNVFGPFGNPFYNSVIATFSHQLTHNEVPEIHVDGLLKLIYINDLTEVIFKFITGSLASNRYVVPHSAEKKVSEILEILNSFKVTYLERGIIPDISDSFHLVLFNTFRSYIDEKHFPQNFIKHNDQRGTFVEIIKTGSQGQFSYSITKPGITRGNHFHTRKVERFAVIDGEAAIKIRKIGTDKIMEYNLAGDEPSYVDIPIWHTHNISNTGDKDLLTLFWINEHFDPDNPDTYFENV